MSARMSYPPAVVGPCSTWSFCTTLKWSAPHLPLRRRCGADLSIGRSNPWQNVIHFLQFPCCNSGQSWDKELPQPTRDHRMNRLLGFLAVAIEGLELLSNTLFSKPDIMPERCFAIANAISPSRDARQMCWRTQFAQEDCVPVYSLCSNLSNRQIFCTSRSLMKTWFLSRLIRVLDFPKGRQQVDYCSLWRKCGG